ncbi:hypothetical protein [Oligoflexus tunisiensis]|nr:hypothetical protein [Oligoflexus tunisiensis]
MKKNTLYLSLQNGHIGLTELGKYSASIHWISRLVFSEFSGFQPYKSA